MGIKAIKMKHTFIAAVLQQYYYTRIEESFILLFCVYVSGAL